LTPLQLWDRLVGNTNGRPYNTFSGTKWYNSYNKYHREDGPAKEYKDGSKEWWLNDSKVYCKRENNLHKFNDLSEEFKKSIVKYKLSGSFSNNKLSQEEEIGILLNQVIGLHKPMGPEKD
jgi:hypothetical protein